MLLPAFHRFPKEGAIVGRILAGYGDIEFLVGTSVGYALADTDTVLSAMFRVRSETSRLKIADALGRHVFEKIGSLKPYTVARDAARCCLRIRNQYAHCLWADDEKAGLFFTNLEDAAEKEVGFEYRWLHIDLALLEKQEAFFVHTRRCLHFLEHEAQIKTGGLEGPNPFPKPRGRPQPNRHNPPEKHIPPWRVPTP